MAQYYQRGGVRKGWVERLLKRHPELLLRLAQLTNYARNEATLGGFRFFFNKLPQHSVERNLTADLLYNVDKTGFSHKYKSEKFIALWRSGIVWNILADSNFHMTYVVAVSENVAVVAPPLLIFPGQRLNQDLLDGCDIPGAVVTCAPVVFMNSSLFMELVEHFAFSVTYGVKRLLVLVYDGCSSHYNAEIVARAVELEVVLVLLPDNSTNLIQTLGISVFKMFKPVLRRCITSFMITEGNTMVTKSTGWRYRIRPGKKG